MGSSNISDGGDVRKVVRWQYAMSTMGWLAGVGHRGMRLCGGIGWIGWVSRSPLINFCVTKVIKKFYML